MRHFSARAAGHLRSDRFHGRTRRNVWIALHGFASRRYDPPHPGRVRIKAHAAGRAAPRGLCPAAPTLSGIFASRHIHAFTPRTVVPRSASTARSVSTYVARPPGASRCRISPSLRLAHSGPPKSRRRGKATGQSQSHDKSHFASAYRSPPRRGAPPLRAARTASPSANRSLASRPFAYRENIFIRQRQGRPKTWPQRKVRPETASRQPRLEARAIRSLHANELDPVGPPAT